MRWLLLMAGLALSFGAQDGTVTSLLGTAARAYVLWTGYLVVMGVLVVVVTRAIADWRMRRLGLLRAPHDDRKVSGP